jgi:hypothetical protein
MNIKLRLALLASAFLMVIPWQAIAKEPVSMPLPTQTNTTCEGSIDSVKAELAKKGYFIPWKTGAPWHRTIQPRVEINDSKIREVYFNYPSNRTRMVRFMLSGDLNKLYVGFFNSPRLMTTLAARVISACNKVGLVEYAHWHQEYRGAGYFSDNTVREFTYTDTERIDNPHTRNIKINGGTKSKTLFEWGYRLY